MIERLDAMRELHRSGWTLERIGIAFELSRERVRQILENAGITKADGGRTVISIENRRRLRTGLNEVKERRVLKYYGCSHGKALELNKGRNLSDSTSRAHIYIEQRRNANTRSVPWKITFPEWCRLWDESGKWDERGRGRGKFCMARQADSGPYSVANIYICENVENIKDGYKVRNPRDELGMTPKLREAHELFAAGKSNGEVAMAMGLKRQAAAGYRCILKKYFSQGVAA